MTGVQTCALPIYTSEVTRIQYAPRNDVNHIVIGNLYELFYWDNKWVSLGRQTAKEHELVYDNVPSNALLWLRNYTEIGRAHV